MNIKKIIASLLAIIIATATTKAQEATPTQPTKEQVKKEWKNKKKEEKMKKKEEKMKKKEAEKKETEMKEQEVKSDEDKMKHDEGKKEHQDKKEHEGKRMNQIDKAKAAFTKVGLNADQQTKAIAVLQKEKAQLDELKATNATPEEKMEKMKAIRQAGSKELTEIMGQEKFDAWRKEMRAENEEMRDKFKKWKEKKKDGKEEKDDK